MGEWSIYLIRCGDGTLYTGVAADVSRRLAEHAAGDGRGAKYLRGRGPLELVLARSVGEKSVALRLEHRIKRLKRAEKETLLRDRGAWGRLVDSVPMQSKATTVEQYLKSLPADRRAGLEIVRRVILDNLDSGYEEGMQYGMIGYYIPHRLYPNGYHCDPKQPLPFGGLASQKNHSALYLMCLYTDPDADARFREKWARTGKKLDMGKSCIRFKAPEELALDVIGQAVKAATIKKYVAVYESVLARGSKGAAKSSAAKAGAPATKRKVAKASGRPVAKKVAKKSAKKVARKVARKTAR